MFGSAVPHCKEDGHVNSGIGLCLCIGLDEGLAPLRFPTHTFDDKLETSIGGTPVTLIHAPGETDDQIVVWLPSQKLLVAADNVYEAFPNLYTIRGTANRDTLQWADTLDKMRALRPRIMVPCHTFPVKGEDEIANILQTYADGIRFVHDQTVRRMNKGEHPISAARAIQEDWRHHAKHLSSHPYLREHYGTVEWSSRAVTTGYVGWFSGRGSELWPLSPPQRAKEMLALVGSGEKLVEAAEQALVTAEKEGHGDRSGPGGAHPKIQWALELAQTVLDGAAEPSGNIISRSLGFTSSSSSSDTHSSPEALKQARDVKIRALRMLAAAQISANGRNYLLSAANETAGELQVRPSRALQERTIEGMDLSAIFMMFSVLIVPSRASQVTRLAAFQFPASGQCHWILVRRGICQVAQSPLPSSSSSSSSSFFSSSSEVKGEERQPIKDPIPGSGRVPDLIVTSTEEVFKGIVARTHSAAAAIATGNLSCDAGIIALSSFMGLFDLAFGEKIPDDA